MPDASLLGQPPYANLNPLRAIFVIPSKPAPTLADPDAWSPEMLDFIRCCCKKEPLQRFDSAQLASHSFIKCEVTELRKLHENSIEDGTYLNHTTRRPGLRILQRFMEYCRSSRRSAQSSSKIDESNSSLHGVVYVDPEGKGNTGNLVRVDSKSKLNLPQEQQTKRIHRKDSVSSLDRGIDGSNENGGGDHHAKKKSSSFKVVQRESHVDADLALIPTPQTARLSSLEWSRSDSGHETNVDAIDVGVVINRNVRSSSAEWFNTMDSVSSSQSSSALSEIYFARHSDIDPLLLEDPIFLQQLKVLENATAEKYATLRSAHELARQQLIAEAKLRNDYPIDVTSLMNKAAERSKTGKYRVVNE